MRVSFCNSVQLSARFLAPALMGRLASQPSGVERAASLSPDKQVLGGQRRRSSDPRPANTDHAWAASQSWTPLLTSTVTWTNSSWIRSCRLKSSGSA